MKKSTSHQQLWSTAPTNVVSLMSLPHNPRLLKKKIIKIFNYCRLALTSYFLRFFLPIKIFPSPSKIIMRAVKVYLVEKSSSLANISVFYQKFTLFAKLICPSDDYYDGMFKGSTQGHNNISSIVRTCVYICDFPGIYNIQNHKHVSPQ